MLNGRSIFVNNAKIAQFRQNACDFLLKLNFPLLDEL